MFARYGYEICLEPWSFRKTKKGRTIKVWTSRAAYKQYMLESEFADALTAEITREINNEIIAEIYKSIGVENTKDTRTDIEKSIQAAFDKMPSGLIMDRGFYYAPYLPLLYDNTKRV
jgi:Holliday junction resolvase RusA-like endonuclease